MFPRFSIKCNSVCFESSVHWVGDHSRLLLSDLGLHSMTFVIHLPPLCLSTWPIHRHFDLAILIPLSFISIFNYILYKSFAKKHILFFINFSPGLVSLSIRYFLIQKYISHKDASICRFFHLCFIDWIKNTITE